MRNGGSLRLSATFLVLLFVVRPTPTQAQTITFETIPGVGAPTDLMPISNQFEATHGVTFSIEGGGTPILAKVGPPLTAFYYNSCSPSCDDQPAPGQNVGDYFLTDNADNVAPPDPIIISYSSPVAAASGEIIDIDINEQWLIQARSSGVVIDSVTITAGDPGTGDGIATLWSFTRAVPEIDSIRLEYTGDAPMGGVGLAFDNFSPSSATPQFGCGDGILDPGEECDDSNLLSRDGCSNECVVEFCGDLIVQPALGEECEDGNGTDLDGCSSNCTLEPTGSLPIENFTCWKVKDLKNPKFTKVSVNLSDQFATQTADLKKPFLLCTPTGANGSEIGNMEGHLCCYKSKGAKLQKPRPQVQVLGTTLAQQLDVEVKKTFLFCEPCEKTSLP